MGPAGSFGQGPLNRLHLQELQQHAQSEVDRLQHQADELASKAYMGDHDSAAQLSALIPQLAAAKHTLESYKAVQADLNRNDGMKRYLGLIDDQGHAAISIGNPDTATRNAILVPGTGQDTLAINGSDSKAAAMYNAARDANHSLKPGDVAVTTWMGYDRPMSLDHAEFPDLARGGAANLDAFEAGQRASHVGAPSIDTVIGHSYGSTVVGAAASGGHHLDADNVIAVGSPGMLAGHAGELSLDPGAQVYAMRAQNDIIGVAGIATEWTLGPEPDDPGFGAIRLQADPGPAGPLGLPSVAAHSSYWNQGNKALDNMGAIVAGKPPPYVTGDR
ncbi:MAG: alpha/beta hydrolase [Mycobacterium sp.]|uniref:alpha/beta hydrolase n=1 Tax=Mycobacterium sp. TaxID=1785 RepID=UPI00262820EF|nr:alpha/beta hydrolase [Mycobacterium sp.]MDI3312990.1 alpha/beta hydrolase [Mycobacterium sp.]